MSSCESTLFAANLVPVRVVDVSVDGPPYHTRVVGHVCAITVQPIVQYSFLLPGIYRLMSKGRLPCGTGVKRPLPHSLLPTLAGKTKSRTVQTRSKRHPATFRSLR